MALGKPAHLALAALLGLALPAVAACGEDAPQATKAEPARPAKAAAKPVSFERETPLFSFSHGYPADAAALPELAAMLDTERAQAMAELKKQTAEAQKDAAANDYPYNPHMMGINWTTTGNTEPLLALLAEISTFSGGAHGNTGYEALLWDKVASKRMPIEGLFADMKAALGSMRDRYCDALNAERLARRGEYAGESDDMFNACPPFDELVIIPSAVGNDGFDRMMFIAAPYVAGPYVEGVYEISLPIDQATAAGIKPEYRGAFSPAE
ncbi:DUF4163 domain-containing protein [Blastomonas sp. AAP53]|uniref:DUF4163 domain-containing protein n=1 Tax=Blastomonas sp. AAP53 TaxID=1248760 RepID=UPI000316F1AD|nr:DUF4163 domain-containing protein [Blastomonas sp. AAP53]